jgi:hypothetical protein
MTRPEASSRDDDQEPLREQIRRLQAEHDRLETEAKELRRSTDLPSVRGRAFVLAMIVAPLAAMAALTVYRLLFHWFD